MDINLAVAFSGGVVSFLSPCVIPIVPGFLAYLAGLSTDERARRGRLEIFLNSVFFVLGFSLVFAALGVLLNGVLRHAAGEAQAWLSRAGGAFIIFFGLYLTGLFRVPFLERSRVFRTRTFSSRYLTSFSFGAAFAAGWTPCVGAALGAILALAATEPASAFSLLAAYALGLGVPFLVVGAFAARAAGWAEKLTPFVPWANAVFGVLLVIVGILVFTETLPALADFSLLNAILLR